MNSGGSRPLAAAGACLAGSALFGALYPALSAAPYSGRSVSDGLTLAGLVLLAAGLFRLVNRLGQFDSTKYGWKKFWEVIRTRDYVRSRSQLPSLAEYKRTCAPPKGCLPLLAAAALDLAAAAVILQR